jgi:YegS/Rv2252/BmrU family lipid kinase
MIKIAFIFNGSKKLNKKVEGIINECENHSKLEVARFVTQKQKDATQMALECSEKSFDYIIAVGGDGTINEVLNGIMQFEGESPVLGVLPNGTGNDFIKSAKLKQDPSDFLKSILVRKTIQLDIAKIDNKELTHYFLNVADVGFGGKVVEILDRQRKYFGGKSGYLLAILKAFIGFKRPILSITTDDFQYQGSVLMVAICNGSIFGNGLTINPFAKINDGILNITLLGEVTLVDYIKNLQNLKSGKIVQHPEVKYLVTKKIEIRIINGKALTEMDGEFLDCREISVEVLAGKINLLWY